MASTIILSDNGASSGSAGLKQTAGNDGVLILQTTTSGGTATNAIYVDNNQNVALGATSVTTGVSGTETTLFIKGNATNKSASLVFQNNSGTGTGYIGVGESTSITYVTAKTNNALVFGTNDTERARFNAGAPILCLSGGNTSATGTGIAFPASQSASSDANTLDDYEEGSWTPTTVGGITGMTVDTGNCTYVKVGKLVTCHMEINNFSGQSANALIIGGLPFTTSANGEGTFSIMANRITFSGFLTGYLSPNNTRMYFYQSISASDWSAILGTATSSSTAIIATITYIASA